MATITYPFPKFSWNFVIFWNIPYSRRTRLRVINYNDIIMSAMASQITSLTIVGSTVYSDADQRKHQSSASRAFVLGIHRSPVNSPHKGPVTREKFPFDNVIMLALSVSALSAKVAFISVENRKCRDFVYGIGVYGYLAKLKHYLICENKAYEDRVLF